MITISDYYSSTLMYSAICCGISGIVIFIMHFKIKFRKEIVAKYIIGLSISLLLITALMAAYLYSTNENLGTFHIFYVAVVLFTLTFLYIYRNESELLDELYKYNKRENYEFLKIIHEELFKRDRGSTNVDYL